MLATVLCGLFTLYPTRQPQLTSTNRVVFVIMVISSLAFYAMAFRVPVVSDLHPRQLCLCCPCCPIC